jgi:hypothetical protein
MNEALRRILLAAMDTKPGRLLCVDFIKKDGSDRRMLIQAGQVEKHVTGCKTDSSRRAVETRQARHPHLIPVWDHGKQAIRSVNLKTVERIKVDGVELLVN